MFMVTDLGMKWNLSTVTYSGLQRTSLVEIEKKNSYKVIKIDLNNFGFCTQSDLSTAISWSPHNHTPTYIKMHKVTQDYPVPYLESSKSKFVKQNELDGLTIRFRTYQFPLSLKKSMELFPHLDLQIGHFVQI